MTGFSQEQNYDFLVGAELTQIRVNRYTADFKFTESPDINMATEFIHFDAAKKITTRYNIEGSTKDFMVQWLLNLRTTKAEIVSDDVLTLTFENGDTLTVMRRNDGYESMTINGHPGGVTLSIDGIYYLRC